MNIIAIIPARYESTRFPGKPLADIAGKPMIWWVYNKVKNTGLFNDVFCAIDDARIQQACDELNIKYVLTRNNHPDHISRIQEVSNKVEADYYVCINGDEPLISKNCIAPAIPEEIKPSPYFCGAYRELNSISQAIDPANIKIVLSNTGRCLYMSRTPVPYPKGTLDVSYKKYVGVECFDKSALDIFVNSPMGSIEKVEDIDHLRFLENGVDLHFSLVESDSISVDTRKDLDFVIEKMKERIEAEGEEFKMLNEAK